MLQRFLSRRAITSRLGAKLFANPWPDYSGLYWVKHVRPKARTTVLVRPDAAGQESMKTAGGAKRLYESLLTAISQCNEQGIKYRHLRKNKIVVFDLSDEDTNEVTFHVREIRPNEVS